jgi:trehalose/maltose hydrolase-like predicted phosphorylase
MAGSVYAVLDVYCGLDLTGDEVVLCPDLPEHWKKLEFNFDFRGNNYFVKINEGFIEILFNKGTKEKIKVHICGKKIELRKGEKFNFKTK